MTGSSDPMHTSLEAGEDPILPAAVKAAVWVVLLLPATVSLGVAALKLRRRLREQRSQDRT